MMRAVKSPKEREHMIEAMPQVHPGVEAQQQQQSRQWLRQIEPVKEAEMVAGAPTEQGGQAQETEGPVHQSQGEVSRRVMITCSRVYEFGQMWKCGLRNPQYNDTGSNDQWLRVFHLRTIGVLSIPSTLCIAQ